MKSSVMRGHVQSDEDFWKAYFSKESAIQATQNIKNYSQPLVLPLLGSPSMTIKA